MKNIFLGAEEFSHRLNMSGFTNIEKSISTEEFSRNYQNGKFHIFEKSAISSFMKSVQDAIGGEIVKGGFNDTPEVDRLLSKAKQDLSSLKRVLINDGPGTERVVFVKAIEDNLEKAKSDDLEKGENGEELEKGIVEDALEYSDKIIFKKTGKEIKEKLEAIKTQETVELSNVKDMLDKCLLENPMKPTRVPGLWGSREGLVIPYMIFNWNQTYCDSERSFDPSADANCRACDTPEEALANSSYNDLVHKFIDLTADLRMIELYLNNIKDEEKFELSARQMLMLKF